MKRFPVFISDYVRLDYSKDYGFHSVILEPCGIILCNLSFLRYKGNAFEASHYIGIMFCNYLKNKTTRHMILLDYWANEYLDYDILRSCLDDIDLRVAVYIKDKTKKHLV